MKLDIPNLIGCCICLNVDGAKGRAETIVHGYAVCTDHSMLIDRHATLRSAVDAAARAQGHRQGGSRPPTGALGRGTGVPGV